MVLFASPEENGNTSLLVKWFIKGAKSKGAKVELVNVAKLKYKVNGCTSCQGCQHSLKYECVIKDEASPIIARVPRADTLVLATPVYFFGPTAQLKLFLDRMYSLFKFERGTGKVRHRLNNMQLCLIASASGGLDHGLSLTEDTFKALARLIGMKFSSLLVPAAGISGAIKSNKEIQKKAIALGGKLAK